jgi:hypothetical protein
MGAERAGTEPDAPPGHHACTGRADPYRAAAHRGGRAEPGRNFALPKMPAVLTPYLFAATGERILEQPTTLEQASVHASNVGGGLRINVAGNKTVPTDFYGFVEASRQHTDDPAQDNGWRLFIGGVVRY